MNTCRAYVVEIMNDLEKIANNTIVPGVRTAALNKQTLYFAILDVIVRTDVDKTTKDYKDALAGLDKAEKSTKKALEEINETAAAITKAADAAKLVDKAFGAALSLA